ncbi:hypothetical protein GCM10010994_48060 [Chelatococcus reniformis]|uniref:Tryptophan 2-monooxygenase n=1 Tax=Chelatococcus reniformis TaxID=1494448 RepID=A0A916USA6_9HYPH|nr:hypothetical protein GCM10010994_48060 [Chelatococcus reniformis]
MAMTRRTFVAAAAAGAVAGPAVVRAAEAPHHVVVIGAGAAGLAAARELLRLRRQVTVLEARERIGGRAHTDTSLGLPFDAGAAYIHWAEDNPWLRYARESGASLVVDRWTPGAVRVFDRGAAVPAERAARRRASFGSLSRLTEDRAASGEDASFAELSAGDAELRLAAGGLTRLALGEDPERVSVADYVRLASGTDYLVEEGYGHLVARYNGAVPVRLGTAATAVHWDGAGVVVDTAGGSVRADAAVVTVPVGVLQGGTLAFKPGLPAATCEAIDGLAMGALTKIALRLQGNRFGFADGMDLFDIGDADNPVDLELWSFRRDLVVAHLGGDGARALCEAGEPAAVAFALDKLTAIVGGRPTRLRAGASGGLVDGSPGPRQLFARAAGPCGGAGGARSAGRWPPDLRRRGDRRARGDDRRRRDACGHACGADHRPGQVRLMNVDGGLRTLYRQRP